MNIQIPAKSISLFNDSFKSYDLFCFATFSAKPVAHIFTRTNTTDILRPNMENHRKM